MLNKRDQTSSYEWINTDEESGTTCSKASTTISTIRFRVHCRRALIDTGMLSFGFIILKMQRFESLDIIKFWYRCVFFCSFGAWFNYFSILVLNVFEFFPARVINWGKNGSKIHKLLLTGVVSSVVGFLNTDAVNSIWHTQSAKGNAISSTVKK